jgi:hypothetical protein
MQTSHGKRSEASGAPHFEVVHRELEVLEAAEHIDEVAQRAEGSGQLGLTRE